MSRPRVTQRSLPLFLFLSVSVIPSPLLSEDGQFFDECSFFPGVKAELCIFVEHIVLLDSVDAAIENLDRRFPFLGLNVRPDHDKHDQNSETHRTGQNQGSLQRFIHLSSPFSPRVNVLFYYLYYTIFSYLGQYCINTLFFLIYK